MFFHNFKYTLKTLFKSKSLLFWTFAFPIIMGIFFNMAFSGFDEKETFNPIDIAVVETTELEYLPFKKALDSVSTESSEFQAFNTQYVTEEKAKELLENDDIIAYILYKDNKPEIVINYNSTDATITKSVIDEINSSLKITNDLAEDQIISSNAPLDYNELASKIALIFENSTPNIKDVSGSNLSYITIEYYTLIAMTCLYGGTISMYAINISLANMSSKGKRISISPTKKITTILSSLLASFITQLFGVFLLLAFLYFVIKVDFGSSMPHCILLSIVGSLAGLSLGLFTGTIFKTNENTKIGIIIAISMTCSFLSGMMGVVLKYYIDKYVPIINKVNPASMITDAFYSLYYYDTLNRFYFNIISLLIFSFILILISTLVLRRQKYESI